MSQVKISVVTWDASFRESFHTVDFFAEQSFPKEDYEFIWVEYYSDVNPRLREKISGVGNARIIRLRGEGEWHLGKCLNEGIRQSRGEILVIPDGDIVVEPDFLDVVWDVHSRIENLVLYFRRWDEPEGAYKLPITLQHLQEVCQLRHQTNYGGCLTTRRECIEYVRGYEEHPIFAGAGTIIKEVYTRLKNAGFPIMWHPSKRIYHPWHPNSLRGTHKLKRDRQLWVIQCRDLSVDYVASIEQVQEYLDRFVPQVEGPKSSALFTEHKIRGFLRKARRLGRK